MKIKDIPLFLKPLFYLYGFLVGELVNFYYWLTRTTCKIKIINSSKLEDHAVFVLWHGNLNFYFSMTRNLKKQVWLNHPYAYMMPYYYLLKRLGTAHIALGSTGSSGKEAAQELLVYLKKGYSTVVALDGPYGPAHEAKSGAFYFALKAKIPLVPLKFSHNRCLTINTWDKKTFLIPFLSSLKVEVLDPLYIYTENEISESKIKIKAALNATKA